MARRHQSLMTCLALIVSLLCSMTCAGPSNGSVSLWSDSGCNSYGDTSNFGQQDPIGLMSLLPDTCGVPGATVHSYRVRSNATCSNGTTAGFSYFITNNCAADPTDENPNPPKEKRQSDNNLNLGSNPQLSGECLALVAFNSVAFICDGVNGKSQQIPNSQLTSKAQSSSPTATGSSQPNAGFGSSSNDANSTAATSSSTTTAASSSGRSSGSGGGDGGAALSPGATAGIGVGTAFGVICLAVLFFFAWKGWKAMRDDVVPDSGPVSVAGTVRNRRMRGALNAVPVESGGDAVHEKGDAAGASEMATHRYQ